MPLPFEALIPFGLLTVMFAATGTLLNTTKRLANEGLPPRYNIDNWDHMMMERDKRLTGTLRGQSTEPYAPADYVTSGAWGTERIS